MTHSLPSYFSPSRVSSHFTGWTSEKLRRTHWYICVAQCFVALGYILANVSALTRQEPYSESAINLSVSITALLATLIVTISPKVRALRTIDEYLRHYRVLVAVSLMGMFVWLLVAIAAVVNGEFSCAKGFLFQSLVAYETDPIYRSQLNKYLAACTAVRTGAIFAWLAVVLWVVGAVLAFRLLVICRRRCVEDSSTSMGTATTVSIVNAGVIDRYACPPEQNEPLTPPGSAFKEHPIFNSTNGSPIFVQLPQSFLRRSFCGGNNGSSRSHILIFAPRIFLCSTSTFLTTILPIGFDFEMVQTVDNSTTPSHPQNDHSHQTNLIDVNLYPNLSRRSSNTARPNVPNNSTTTPSSHIQMNGPHNTTNASGHPTWDLYPLAMRTIENSGTDSQRRTLHSL
ncbi:uncharacterized protein VTP21DRAFT_281 [Calcarisporiella thermophila]|uniref:uncharacterized protein n=1 Tax=Calcarisporiella thermophila TaxID=911321 RepID=UPI003742579E